MEQLIIRAEMVKIEWKGLKTEPLLEIIKCMTSFCAIIIKQLNEILHKGNISDWLITGKM